MSLLEGASGDGASREAAGMSRLPIVFVVVSLLALALVPFWIDRREAEIERQITEVLEPGRSLAMDLAFIHSRQISRFQRYLFAGDRTSFQRYNEARTGEQVLYDSLVALTDRMELDVRNKVAELYAVSTTWHVMHASALESEAARRAYVRDLSADQRRSEQLIEASSALTNAILVRLEEARARMDRERELELRLTIGLVALALFSTLMVAGIGRRLRFLVAEASAQRQGAERARREVDAILQATGDGVLGLDLRGGCTFLNPAGARLLGIGERAATGRHVHDVVHGDRAGHGREDCPILAAIRKGTTVTEPADVVWDEEGQPIPVQWTLEPLVQRASVRGAVLTFADMSDIHRAQDELRQAVRARDEVVAVVSHDLRNPLGAITGAAGLLLELDLPPEKRSEQLRLIGRAAERMNRLIGDLLDVARIESGGLSVHTEPVDVADLFDEAVELMEPLAQERGLKLFCRIDPTVRTVRADRDRVLQVLSNLVGNAVKFSRRGEVRLSVRRGDDGWAVFSVSDEGPGIPPEAAAHLFDRFWRQNQADRQGAGLGLAIVQGIVRAHGGEVWVDSRPGEGATFSFTLVLDSADVSERLAPASAAMGPRPSR